MHLIKVPLFICLFCKQILPISKIARNSDLQSIISFRVIVIFSVERNYDLKITDKAIIASILNCNFVINYAKVLTTAITSIFLFIPGLCKLGPVI